MVSLKSTQNPEVIKLLQGQKRMECHLKNEDDVETSDMSQLINKIITDIPLIAKFKGSYNNLIYQLKNV